jgi:isoleucyl-tRNA synthetase
MDKWVLSRLNSAVKDTDKFLGEYKIPEAAKVLESFVDDLSNWYVRRSRERFWAKGMEQDKINAYMTLYTSLVTISKAAAPLIPFMTEEIYQNLVCSIDASQPESIHLCDYPVANEDWIDADLEAEMGAVLKVVVLGRAARNDSKIKNRQPLAKMFVKTPRNLSEYYTDIVKDELNVKEVELKDDLTAYTTYEFKPNLPTVGPKYGKFLGKIRGALAEIDGNAAYGELKANGVLRLPEVDESIELVEEDLLIQISQMEGFQAAADGDVTVVLDTNLTEELLEEGFARELISKIQTMRKEADFEVMDRIHVYYEGTDKIAEIFEKKGDFIAGEVLANEITKGGLKGYQKEWNINNEAVTLSVERI